MGRNSKERALTETREAIFTAGERLFAELGYAATKIDAIATQAGFTRGAFYRHFPSKEDFFLALLDRRSASQHADWGELVQVEPEQALDAVGAWLEANLRRQEGFDAAVQEFTAFASRHPALLDRLRQREDAVVDVLARLLAPEGAPPQSELARLVLAVGEGLAVQLGLSAREKATLFTAALGALGRQG